MFTPQAYTTRRRFPQAHRFRMFPNPEPIPEDSTSETSTYIDGSGLGPAAEAVRTAGTDRIERTIERARTLPTAWSAWVKDLEGARYEPKCVGPDFPGPRATLKH